MAELAGTEDGPLFPATHYLLDVLHSVQTKHPGKCARAWPLGVAVGRRALGAAGGCELTPPSVAAALLDLTACPGFSSALPFVRFSGPDDPISVVSQALIDGAVPNITPPPAIPISGAAHECFQLQWNRPGVPACSSGPECVAALLPGAPGPLPIYLTPAEEADRTELPAPHFCLMCIRADAAALVKTLGAVVRASGPGLGCAAMAMPPFQNLVNCPDGYKESCLGVRPFDSAVFTPISIAGPGAASRVEYDPAPPRGGFYVDQQDALWGVTAPPALNGQAPCPPPARGSSACSKPSSTTGATATTSAPPLGTRQ